MSGVFVFVLVQICGGVGELGMFPPQQRENKLKSPGENSLYKLSPVGGMFSF